MIYLYLGRLFSLDGLDIVGFFEVVDRLCLKYMIKVLEYEIVIMVNGEVLIFNLYIKCINCLKVGY